MQLRVDVSILTTRGRVLLTENRSRLSLLLKQTLSTEIKSRTDRFCDNHSHNALGYCPVQMYHRLRQLKL